MSDLKPAHPDPLEPGYRLRLPWPWIVGGVLLVAGLAIFQLVRSERETSLERAAIEGAFDGELAPVVKRYRDFRSKLEGWVVDAAKTGEVEDFVDPRLKIGALHRGNGVYLRIAKQNALSPEAVDTAIRKMGKDAITRCLGVTPESLRSFYEAGEFLMPPWRERVANEKSFERLKVLREDLSTRVERDLPLVLESTQADYFLFALQHDADDRHADLTDVYLYDLRTDELLLRKRAVSKGKLIPARIVVAGVKPPPPRPMEQSYVAGDCSIASQVKELTGEPTMDFGASMPEKTPEAEAPAAAEGKAAVDDKADDTSDDKAAAEEE